GLSKNHRIQLLPIERSAHAEDIAESETAIAQIFLANFWQCHLLSSGSGNNLHWQWELILPVGTLNLAVGMPCAFYSQHARLIYPISDSPWIARPMIRLLEKDTPFFFSKECVEAFQTLKRKLTKAPILIAPDWDLPFELMCDVSDFAIGAVLGQCQEKHFRLIHYASKTMTEAESNYTTTKKEMLAVVYAFEKFRSYLIMNKS
nr:reverse transcriptase domain-containing protein [Tanacetum cinerariifolium]